MTEAKVEDNVLFVSRKDDNKNIKCVVSFLGYFEIYAAVNFWLSSNEKLSVKFGIIPPLVIENDLVRFVYITFIATLGMQRLTWAHGISSERRITFYYWMNLVFTHGIESMFWWGLARYKFFK
jgi:hypothetical protein